LDIPYKNTFYLLFTAIVLIACKKEKISKSAPMDTVSYLIEKFDDTSNTDEVNIRYTDSAYSLLADYKNDSVTRRLYKSVSSNYYNFNKLDKSIKVSQKLYKLSFRVKDTLNIANALYLSGDAYYLKSQNDSALYYYSQAEKLYKTIEGEKETLGNVMLYKAYTYHNFGEYKLCENEAIKALKILSGENNDLSIYSCYNTIAAASDGLGNSKEAIKYYNMAMNQIDKFSLKEFPQDEINRYKAGCYNNMGMVYEKGEMYLKAISLYREALIYKDVLNSKALNLYASLLNNIAHAKFKSGDYSELPGLYFKSLRIRDSLGIKSGVITSKINIAEYYTSINDTISAISYYINAYSLAKEQKSGSDILRVLKILPDIDKSKRDFYYKRYIDVNDSINSIDKLERQKFARIEYETDRLEDEKEALLKRNSYIIGASAAALLFIGAIFIIYYLDSRNRKLMLIQEQQKANEEIYQLMFQQQSKVDDARSEEKNRIAMELHDGILNNIYAVRLNLEFINKKADEESVVRRKQYIKELQNVEMEIREVSHDLSRNAIFNQDVNFTNLLEFMVKSQKNTFGTNFDIDIDSSINWDDMSNIFKVNIYRIIQEAIQNINKYSQAQNSKINIIKQDKIINITITDDGVGFDTTASKGGIGIKNLKKRASLIGGKFTIQSQPQQGTTVQVAFPY